MALNKQVVSVYFTKEELKELDRRANYQRVTRSQWVKARILTILNEKRSK